MSGEVVVLDGGLATALTTRGHDLSDRLWSARVLMTDPEAIEAVHLDYFRAGAQVATTASYQASIEGFEAVGSDRETALDLIRRSVRLADSARRRFRDDTPGIDDRGPLLVAGSVGPYGAMLADGSEYRGDYDVDAPALAAFHRPRMEALVEAGADLLAFETIPTIEEAEVLVRLTAEIGARGWLSYSCRDGRTTSAGEPIEDAVALGDDPCVIAVGVNCTAPRFMPELLTRASGATKSALIAYPNGGDRWDPDTRDWVAGPGGAFEPGTAAGWTRLGVAWLGGCCGTGPADIQALTDALAPVPEA
jgi:homocysteine S-methyltransferase